MTDSLPGVPEEARTLPLDREARARICEVARSVLTEGATSREHAEIADNFLSYEATVVALEAELIRRSSRSSGSPEIPDCDEDTHYWTGPEAHGAACKCGEKAWRGAITPEAWALAARKAFAMYDWNKNETRCINDFILTCDDAAAELLNGSRPSPGEAGAPTCPQYIEKHGYCVLATGHAGDCTLNPAKP